MVGTVHLSADLWISWLS